MSTPLRNLCILLLLALISLAHAGSAHAARHALLIGNDSYQEVPALRNARADAIAMGSALQKAGYTVTVMQDRNLKQMKDDVREFKSRIKGGDEVFFFYSGHGVQIEAMNYLLPVDVRAESEDQVRDDALALSTVLSDLREQKPALTLAVVDACRDNPFKGTGRAIGGRGLTGVGGANGQMVIYSAGEGQQALDRLSEGDPVNNGLFTRVFMKEMERPGVPIDQVARQVRAEVNRQALTVKHEQVPAIYDQVIGQFYFYAQKDAAVDEVELVFWQSIKDSSDPAELKAYLEKYPDGQFSGLAAARVKRLEQTAAVGPTATPNAGPTTTQAAPVPVAAEQTPVAEAASTQDVAVPSDPAPAPEKTAAAPEQAPAPVATTSTPGVEMAQPAVPAVPPAAEPPVAPVAEVPAPAPLSETVPEPAQAAGQPTPAAEAVAQPEPAQQPAPESKVEPAATPAEVGAAPAATIDSAAPASQAETVPAPMEQPAANSTVQ